MNHVTHLLIISFGHQWWNLVRGGGRCSWVWRDACGAEIKLKGISRSGPAEVRWSAWCLLENDVNALPVENYELIQQGHVALNDFFDTMIE